MIDKQITTVLFDLDGTLLPMDQKVFIGAYFKELAKKAAPYGCDPEKLVAGVWKGTEAMIKNDGSKGNCDRFWEVFAEDMGQDILKLRPVFDEFYGKEFHNVKAATRENPMARKLVGGLKAKGYDVILATNPVFPMVGVETRLSWVSLKREDFIEVTSYEGYSACKPNPAYFEQILKKTGKKPEECLMVGNDATEDTAALKAGISTYIIKDCLINTEQRDISRLPQGSFKDFMAYAGIEE